jgi:hypothetical protein
MTQDIPDDETIDKMYRCPHCSATYSDELFVRVHITRGDDEAHQNRHGLMPEEEIEVIDEDNNVIKTISRRPEEIDLTAVTCDDFPDELNAKRKHGLLVATQNPEEDNKRRIAEIVEQQLENKECEIEPPAERTVGRALDEFYHPHMDNTNDNKNVNSLGELTPKQQTILIAKLADSSASGVDIAEMAGCAKSYPCQVVNRYGELLSQLDARVEGGETPQSIIEEELSTDDIATLVNEDLLSELPVNIEAIRPTMNGESSESDSNADAAETISVDNQDEPIEQEYDPSRWGSPVDHSTGLEAAPESPIETEENVNNISSAEAQTDGGSEEFEPVKINHNSATDDETGAETETETETEAKTDLSGEIPASEVQRLKKNTKFLQDVVEQAEIDDVGLIAAATQQVERRCNKLLQSYAQD